MIAQIAFGNRAVEFAPFIFGLFILGQGIGDQRKGADILAEHLAEGFSCGATAAFVRVGEQVEHLSAS